MHKLIKESIKSTHVFLITVLTVVSIVFIMAYQVHQSYKQIWDSASIVNRNILLVVANILENNFRTAIMSLEGTKEKLSQLKNDRDTDWFIENLFYDLSNYSVFGAELILDKDGNVLHSSPGFSENVVDPNKNLAHLEYFYQHKNNADQGNADLGVFLGKPFISRVDNKPRIPISIRYDDENGNFAGVISQTLKTSEINKMFSYLELGESAGLNMHFLDGTPLILFPFEHRIYTENFSNNHIFQKIQASSKGDVRGISPIDGKNRFYSYLTLKDYPLVISIVKDAKVVTGEWRSRTTWVVFVTLLLVSIVSGLVYIMYEQLNLNKRANQQIDNEKEGFKITLEAINDSVLVVDKNSCVAYLNPSAERILACSLVEAKGKLFTELFKVYDENTNKEIKNTNIHKAIKNKRFISAVDNRLVVNKNGDRYPIEISVSPLFSAGDLIAVVAVLHDVSNKREQVNQMKYLAQHDALTGMPNRRYLETIGDQVISQAKFNNGLVGLLFLDLDNFKNVNDTLGHAGGDQILIQSSNRFKSALRSDDVLIRNGGDEFIVLVSKFNQESDLIELAERIIKTVQTEFLVGDKTVNITTSVGIAAYPKHANNLTDLIEYADQAMYTAKKMGRNRYSVYKNNV